MEKPDTMTGNDANIWPDRLMLRDTRLHDDMGGAGERIYTTAGQGYEKREYVRADICTRPPLSTGEYAELVGRLNAWLKLWRLDAWKLGDSDRGRLTNFEGESAADTVKKAATALATLSARAEEKDAALVQCGKWFDEYAEGHTAKEAYDKAKRNLDRAHYAWEAAGLNEEPVRARSALSTADEGEHVQKMHKLPDHP